MRRPRFLLALATLALLGACAAPAMVYQRLDWFAGWRLKAYVELDGDQRTRFEREFGEVWTWHRRQELPVYAQDLRAIAAALDPPPGPPDVAAWQARFQAHWQRTATHALADFCPLLQSLDDAQVREVIDEVDEGIERFADDYVERSDHKLRRQSRERTSEWITRWTGPLNPGQEALLKRWGEERRALGPQWLEFRRQWRGAVAAALANRRSDGCAALAPLVVTPLQSRPGDVLTSLDHNAALWQRLVADIVAAMDDRQRAHARRELTGLAGKLEQLAKR